MIIGLVTEVGEQALGCAGNRADVPQGGAARPHRRNSISRQRAFSARRHRISDHRRRRRACSASASCGSSMAAPTADRAQIGDLQQNPNIAVHIDIDKLVSRHFAILGATGVGKSSGVAIILQKILETRPNLRIFLVDPHNEYGRCFGDKAQVLNPRNLRLPFWLFNFEEIDRRLLRRPPRRRRGSRNSLRGHSARQGRLSAIPQQRRQRPPARPSAAIRRTPASPPTRRCPTASRT